MRILHALRYDILFQYRHRFYHAYALITAAYVAGLLLMPQSMRPMATVFLLFSDTATLGFFFIGAIVLLEKDQNMLASLFVTPLRLHEYFIAKVLSLAFISLSSALLILIFTQENIPRLSLFMAGFLLSSALFTILGVYFAVIAKNVNDYFLKSLSTGLIAALPLLGWLDIIKSPFLKLLPTHATLVLIDVVFHDHQTSHLIFQFVNLMLWLAASAWFVARTFVSRIILRAGKI